MLEPSKTLQKVHILALFYVNSQNKKGKSKCLEVHKSNKITLLMVFEFGLLIPLSTRITVTQNAFWSVCYYGSSKNIVDKLYVYKSYIFALDKYKQDLALNNLQGSICLKIQPIKLSYWIGSLIRT